MPLFIVVGNAGGPGKTIMNTQDLWLSHCSDFATDASRFTRSFRAGGGYLTYLAKNRRTPVHRARRSILENSQRCDYPMWASIRSTRPRRRRSVWSLRQPRVVPPRDRAGWLGSVSHLTISAVSIQSANSMFPPGLFLPGPR